MQVMGWVWVALIGGVQLAGWGVLFGGGMPGVAAFVVLASLVPLLGVFSLLGGAVVFLRRRRMSGPIAGSLLLSLPALWPGLWSFGIATVTYPTSQERMQPSATVRLPAAERLRVAWGGDSVATNQHAAMPDQRWAYDLVVEPAFVGSKRLEDYGCWSKPVLAPVAARVHRAVDGQADLTPGEVRLDEPLGNHVVLRLPTDTFLILAHLRRGSLLVKEGEMVAEGQPLGRCGNSGHSSEPHIHLHHQRQDPKQFPLNFAEGLPLYFRDHDGAPMPLGGIEVEGGKPIARGALVQHIGARSAL